MSDLDAWDHDPDGPGREEAGSLSRPHRSLYVVADAGPALAEALRVLREVVACEYAAETGYLCDMAGSWRSQRLFKAMASARALTAKFPEETP
jgi:hypothetical protein